MHRTVTICALVTLCALLHQAGRVSSLAVMSVDLGHEFLKIAIVKPGVPMEIALNKEGRRKTANIVGFKDGERQFADAALSSKNINDRMELACLLACSLSVCSSRSNTSISSDLTRSSPRHRCSKEAGNILSIHQRLIGEAEVTSTR